MHRRQPISSQCHSGLHGTTRGSGRLRWKRGAALNLFLRGGAVVRAPPWVLAHIGDKLRAQPTKGRACRFRSENAINLKSA